MLILIHFIFPQFSLVIFYYLLHSKVSLVTYAVNIYGKICHMQSTVPRLLCVCLVAQSFLTLLWPQGLWPARFLCLWDFSGKNTRMGCHFLLRGSWPRYGSCVSCVASRFFTHWAIREALLGTLEDSKRNWMLLLSIWNLHYIVFFHPDNIMR